MAIFLRQSWNVKPPRWGSPADVMYAIKVNSEKIYGIDPGSNVLNIVGFWGLPLLDFSGKNNHGTNHGATYKDGSLDFDGSNDYVHLGDTSSLSVTGSLTLSVWVFVGREPDMFGQAIIDKYSYPANQRAYKLNIDSNVGTCASKPFFVVSSTANPFTGGLLCSDMQLSANTWYHVVAVFDAGSSMKIYIDGSDHTGAMASGSAPASIADSTAQFAIGADGNGAGPFKGLIDEVRISNIAFTADQIALFYDCPWALYQPVSRPVYFFQGRWTGKIKGITNPAKICGVAVADIASVMSVS